MASDKLEELSDVVDAADAAEMERRYCLMFARASLVQRSHPLFPIRE